MPKINIACFSVLFFLFSCYSKAQTENKTIHTETHSTDKGSVFFTTRKVDCINLPFGYSDLSKRITVDSALAAIQDKNKLRQINALQFEKVIKKDLVSLTEEYDTFLPFNKNVNEKDRIAMASDFLCFGDYSLYFMADYNTIRYAEPFIEKIYLVSTKGGKLIDMKRIYLHHEGEMGFANYTLFNIDKNYIISLQDYEFSENPFQVKPLQQYQILPSGRFARYFDKNGSYKNEEEQGMVKNHKKEGKWIETKANSSIDLQQYPEFTDPYTYLEAEYKNGLPSGTWKCYKLLQQYNEKTGEPIVNTRKKGRLIYTEMYTDGVLKKREYQ
ncbi:hypothetical protein C1637_05965 [Chryseobacterium lactis]|uniref:Uncharacterized protein n=1 Tax=Chryseobacterium lactis TaxID=1241981 RepID=A0A3G6RIY3_CHRLC|nr:hypothetical protein [Chryseobacterium lactis]AZA84387.1 hypothetical protein EG342_21935 [Chryseobacterium lactis]AZB04775.1 hypothetical protein EG341_12815 [Chryseobacterium lactis]PNW14505.1 hypothetical protein C1637_05965 [Chryseobacterium lactis]